MVASDTVVGLVGAGILLVALVGVFVYESQQGGGDDAELTDANYNVDPAGSTYAFQAGTGTPIPNTSQCAPQPPATECKRAQAQVDLKFCGLPMAYDLKYVAFIEGPSSTARVVEAKLSGKCYVTGAQTVFGNFGTSPKVVVSLEESDSATSPGWKVATYQVSGSGLGPAQDVMLVKSAGNHTLTFTPSSGQTEVMAAFNGLPAAKSGYTYRGWMVKDDAAGTTYVFVGNHTADDNTISGKVSGTKAAYARFIVTMEKGFKTTGPSGPAVVTANYGVAANPTVQK